MSNVKKEVRETTMADRYALNNTRELSEALASLGKFTDEELREMQAQRASVGAEPLRLHNLRHFDSDSIAPIEAFTPQAVRELREREGASQAVFAQHLGVAVNTLGQWERGQRKPEGPAAKLLTLVKAHGLLYIRR